MKLFSSGFLLALSLCLDIGIVNIAMIRAGLDKGFLASLKIGLGSTAGDLVYAILSVLGIGVLLHHSWFRWGIWVGGTTVLLLYSWSALILKREMK